MAEEEAFVPLQGIGTKVFKNTIIRFITMKVGLFIPCYVNAVYPEVGIATYKLLKSLDIDVDYPMDAASLWPMPDSNRKLKSWLCDSKSCSSRMM